jgi:hypothetical protein
MYSEDLQPLVADYPNLVSIQLPAFIFSDESYSKITEMEMWLYGMDAKMNEQYAFMFVKGDSPIRYSSGWLTNEDPPKVVFGFKDAGIASLFKLAWA